MSKQRQRRSFHAGLPKGAYQLPNGDIAMPARNYVMVNGRRLLVQGIRRETPDLELLAKALVQIALSKVAAERDDQAA